MAKAKSYYCANYDYLLLILCLLASYNKLGVEAKAKPPSIFIFGDSTFDVGTNNFLNGTIALANFPYNGIDFTHSIPTGRFSNGFNFADKLAELFGHESSPLPYLYLVNNMTNFRDKIEKGVNFASGGSGILDETGKKLWNRVIPLGDQIQQFALVLKNISKGKNAEETAKCIKKSLFILGVGSNDILDIVRVGSNLTKDEFMVTLRTAYYQHLKNLYKMGARKFGIIGVAPVGCCPYSRAKNKSEGGDGGCLNAPNEFAQAFYSNLDSLLANMSCEFPKMKYSLANVFEMTTFVFKNYQNFGFKEIEKACCGSGDYNGEGFCNKAQNATLCPKRNEYLFWDLYHPSAAATNLSAITLYYGNTEFVKPISFRQLAGI